MTGFILSDMMKRKYESFYRWIILKLIYWQDIFMIGQGKYQQKEKSYFQFNSAAQKNWIKFSNSDDRTYIAKDSIVVDDKTLDTEKDLYSIKFDLAEQAASGMAEFILQTKGIFIRRRSYRG